MQAELKILLSLGQVLSLVGPTFQISIPEPFRSMAEKLNFLALDVFVLVNLNCLHSYDWGTGFLLRCGMPLVVVTMIKAVATWRTRATLRQCHDRGFEPSTHRRRRTLEGLYARCKVV